MNLITGGSFERMEAAIHAAEMRQRIISNNIANAETPNFKRSEVLFEAILEKTLGSEGSMNLSGRKTNDRHISIGMDSSTLPQATVTTESATSMNNNQNNVDLDREMSLLAKNQLNYNFYIQQINHEFRMVKTAIEGRV